MERDQSAREGGVEGSTVRFVPKTKSVTLVRKLRERDEFMKELERDGGVGGTRFESSSVRERYMAKDPSDIANRIRMED